MCVIPFGGGTTVTEALECPEEEKRMIVSLDMKEMNRILVPTPHAVFIQFLFFFANVVCSGLIVPL